MDLRELQVGRVYTEKPRQPRLQSKFQPVLHRELQASQDYMLRPCLKKKCLLINNKMCSLLIKNNENELENYFHQVYNLQGHLKSLNHGPFH